MIDEPIGGGDAAKFETVGDTVKIRVTDITSRPAMKFQSNEPDVTRSGQPVIEYIFAGTTDDGDDKRIFAKRGLFYAIKEAAAQAGLTNWSELVGGTLIVKFTGEEASETKGFRPRKVYAAKVTKPVAVGLDNDLI